MFRWAVRRACAMEWPYICALHPGSPVNHNQWSGTACWVSNILPLLLIIYHGITVLQCQACWRCSCRVLHNIYHGITVLRCQACWRCSCHVLHNIYHGTIVLQCQACCWRCSCHVCLLQMNVLHVKCHAFCWDILCVRAQI